MKHAILGAGAIGGLVGTVLASIGEDVVVIVRAEKLAAYPSNLSLERPSGVEAITEPLPHWRSRLTCYGSQPRHINCKLRSKL